MGKLELKKTESSEYIAIQSKKDLLKIQSRTITSVNIIGSAVSIFILTSIYVYIFRKYHYY